MPSWKVLFEEGHDGFGEGLIVSESTYAPSVYFHSLHRWSDGDITLPTLVYCVYARASSRTSVRGFLASRPLDKLSSCCMKALERHSSISSV